LSLYSPLSLQLGEAHSSPSHASYAHHYRHHQHYPSYSTLPVVSCSITRAYALVSLSLCLLSEIRAWPLVIVRLRSVVVFVVVVIASACCLCSITVLFASPQRSAHWCHLRRCSGERRPTCLEPLPMDWWLHHRHCFYRLL
jgi:hypothetical protein